MNNMSFKSQIEKHDKLFEENEEEFESIKTLNGQMIDVQLALRESTLKEKMSIPEIEEKIMNLELSVENDQEDFEKKALDVF